jgi:hypothetical protein
VRLSVLFSLRAFLLTVSGVGSISLVLVSLM